MRVGHLVDTVLHIFGSVVKDTAGGGSNLIIRKARTNSVVVRDLIVIQVSVGLHSWLLRHHSSQPPRLITCSNKTRHPIVGFTEKPHTTIRPRLYRRPFHGGHNILLLPGTIPVQTPSRSTRTAQIHLHPGIAGLHHLGIIEEIMKPRIGVIRDSGIKKSTDTFRVGDGIAHAHL